MGGCVSPRARTGARLKISIGNNIKMCSNDNGVKIVNLPHTKI
jgi:hypothetical protein